MLVNLSAGDWSTLAGTEIDIVILQIMYITSKKEIKSPKDHIIYGTITVI